MESKPFLSIPNPRFAWTAMEITILGIAFVKLLSRLIIFVFRLLQGQWNSALLLDRQDWGLCSKIPTE